MVYIHNSSHSGISVRLSKRPRVEGVLAMCYKWLWTHIGGRPWTYIIRDSYHNHPIIWLGVAVSLGILLGHLFFGTPYIPNQGG